MGKWATLLAEKIPAPPLEDTAKTDRSPQRLAPVELEVLPVVLPANAPELEPCNGESDVSRGLDVGTQQGDTRPEPPDHWLGPEALANDPNPPQARPAIWRKLVGLGLDEDRADQLTAWIEVRDIEGDGRRLCAECWHFAQRNKTCRHPHLIAIQAPRDLGQLATVPQNCPGFLQGGGDGF